MKQGPARAIPGAGKAEPSGISGWTYAAPAAASGAGTGREAWITGSGDDTETVYGRRPR